MIPAVELLLLLVATAAALRLGWQLFATGRGSAAEIASAENPSASGAREGAGPGPAARGPLGRRLGRWLASAGIAVPAGVWVAGVVLAAALVGLAVAELFPAHRWVAVTAAVLAVWLPFLLVAEVARWRAQRFEQRLADAIDLMAAALTAGQGTLDALVSAGRVAREPVRSELLALATRLDVSASPEEAMAPLVAAYDAEGVRLFTQMLRAKWEIGGPLAPGLQAVNRTLRQRMQIERQLRAHLAGSQVTALMVALLPFALLPVLAWQRPENLHRLWSFPWGPDLLIGAIVLQVLAFFWLRWIARRAL